MTVMTKKRSLDRHANKKPVQLRLHPALREQLERLCDRNLSTLTAEVTTALRKHLESEGFWPPPAR
jgi:hypothetical protein